MDTEENLRKFQADTEKLTLKQKAFRLLLITAGSVSLVLGITGIFLPILPTTPFLLLAAFCYARSSGRFYSMLMNNRYLGNYIRNYREYRAIPLKTKIGSISLLWITILISAFIFTENQIGRTILIIIAAAVTWHIVSIKTLRK